MTMEFEAGADGTYGLILINGVVATAFPIQNSAAALEAELVSML